MKTGVKLDTRPLLTGVCYWKCPSRQSVRYRIQVSSVMLCLSGKSAKSRYKGYVWGDSDIVTFHREYVFTLACPTIKLIRNLSPMAHFVVKTASSTCILVGSG